MEDGGGKIEVTPAQQDHVVVTAGEVLVALPAAALMSEEMIEVMDVDAADAPVPLPGVVAAGLWRIGTVSELTQFASLVTLRLPYDDADQNGFVDGLNPQLDETQLTLWFFDPAQGWIDLPGAVLIPELNVVVAETDRTGLFGIFRATDGRMGIIGDASDDVIVSAPSADAAGVVRVGSLQDIGLDITTPFVTAWDTTQLSDGDYELRAICTDTPTDLLAFQTTDASGGGSSSCFIATAAYGTPWTPQVRVLRSFRDMFLLTHALGRWLVEQYYRLSPPLADYIRDRSWLRAIVRISLTPVVWTVQAAMFFAGWPLLTLAGLGAVGSVGAGWRLYGKRRHA